MMMVMVMVMIKMIMTLLGVPLHRLRHTGLSTCSGRQHNKSPQILLSRASLFVVIPYLCLVCSAQLKAFSALDSSKLWGIPIVSYCNRILLLRTARLTALCLISSTTSHCASCAGWGVNYWANIGLLSFSLPGIPRDGVHARSAQDGSLFSGDTAEMTEERTGPVLRERPRDRPNIM